MSKQPTKAGLQSCPKCGHAVGTILYCARCLRAYSAVPNPEMFREAIELIDGCKSTIEVYKAEHPSQKEWQKRWMKKANRLIKEVMERKEG